MSRLILDGEPDGICLWADVRPESVTLGFTDIDLNTTVQVRLREKVYATLTWEQVLALLNARGALGEATNERRTP